MKTASSLGENDKYCQIIKLVLIESAFYKIKNLLKNHKENQMAIGTFRFQTPLVCAIVVAFSLTFQFLYAAGSGSIKGHVFDKVTSDPLIGANVVVLNTSLGASSNIDGLITIYGVPAGPRTLKISYVGYETITVQVTVPENGVLEQEFRLSPQVIQGQEVVVTAQASGQNAAINQQLSTDNIVNVVSSARIQALPDANAAESIGRLPGVSLTRSGGEATQIVVRGLEPKFNKIMIDGVEIPGTSNDNRATDLSMVSSNMVEGIELSKTVTPDMDAAVLGGTVNFRIKEAKEGISSTPAISLLAQGRYSDLRKTYNDYKFVASVEDRFFDGRFGVFAQAIVEKVDHTSHEFGAVYSLPDPQNHPDILQLDNINLQFVPRDQRRYDGTLVMDYKLPEGKIALTNLFTTGKTNSQTYTQNYNVSGNYIFYQGSGAPKNAINEVTNILSLEQVIYSVKVNARLSHIYSDNSSPENWFASLQQNNPGINELDRKLHPQILSRYSADSTVIDDMVLNSISSSKSFNKQRNTEGALDLERNFVLSDIVSVTLKMGGMYRYTDRYYNHDEGSGQLFGSDGRSVSFRQTLIQAMGLDQPPYNLNPNGAKAFPYSIFADPSVDFGNFLHGDYSFNDKINFGMLSRVVDAARQFGEGVVAPLTGGVRLYQPNQVESIRHDYTGNESRHAEYFMGNVKIGSDLTIIPGVRYQELKTTYSAARFYGSAQRDNQYPIPIPHTDTTTVVKHGYWLPDAILLYGPFPWLKVRLAYTNTISYPDFNAIIPVLEIYSGSVTWNNYALKPARAQNFDAQLSVFENSVGLFSVGGFLKRIDDMMFWMSTNISDLGKFPDLPRDTLLRGKTLNTAYNNPNRVDVWGIEAEWQTHFWYLPDPFGGLVLNVNYTHIFSEAKYPLLKTVRVTSFPPRPPTYIDTSYSDRLLFQPNDVVNLSIGYDYKKFSILVSMIYQSQVFNGTDFWNARRSDKIKYLRWDISAKQGLPWFGLELYFDINNLNGEDDIYVVRGSGYPTSQSNYGMTADLGLRWRIE
jgi:TonB-dependent receptor